MIINYFLKKYCFCIGILFLISSCSRIPYQVEVQNFSHLNDFSDNSFSIIRSEKPIEGIDNEINTILTKKGFISSKRDFRFAVFYTTFNSKVRLNSVENYYRSALKVPVLVSNLKLAQTILIQVMDIQTQNIVFNINIGGFTDTIISKNQFESILQRGFHEFYIEHKPFIFVSNV